MNNITQRYITHIIEEKTSRYNELLNTPENLKAIRLTQLSIAFKFSSAYI